MRSLYAKFLTFTAGIMLTSAVIAFLAVNTYYHQQLKGQNDEKNMRIAQSIASYVESDEQADLYAYFATQGAAGYKIFITDEDGGEMRFGAPFRVENLPEEAIRQVMDGKLYHGMRDLKTETFMTGFFSDELANTVGVPFGFQGKTYALFMRPDIKLLFTEVHYLLGGMVIVMAVVSLLSMLVVAKKLIEPITKLTAATKMVGEEQFTGRIDINRRDEIGQLAQSFQRMTERLSENDRMRREFISDVSHDFQSPLLNIKGYADLLRDADLPADKRQSYAKVIQSETERLSSLTRQLLLLTSLDQLQSPLSRKTFRLDEQLKEAVRKYMWLLQEKQMSLSMELAETEITGDPSFLEKVWENLISNALKYTSDGGEIQLRLTDTKEYATVEVQDTGMGISNDHLHRLFDRFYRVDTSRTREIEGTGLGLSIVKEVVTLHEGTVAVASEEGKGTVFKVTLPKL